MRSVAVCVCLCLRLSYSGSNFWNHWSRNFTLCLVKAGISSEYPAQYRTSMSPGQGQGHGSRKVKRTHSRVVCLRLKCNLLFLQISMAKITLNSIVKIFSHACQLAKQQVQTSSNARFAPAVSVCRWNSVNKTSSQVCENFGYDAWQQVPWSSDEVQKQLTDVLGNGGGLFDGSLYIYPLWLSVLWHWFSRADGATVYIATPLLDSIRLTVIFNRLHTQLLP